MRQNSQPGFKANFWLTLASDGFQPNELQPDRS